MSPPANPAGRSQGRIGLHSLAPAAGSRRVRKRVGRGEGSGTGKTAGRGQKGAGSRSGSKRRARLEGGQMPIHMRMRKLRGPHMKKSMPFEPFRTHTQPVNLAALEERFDAGAEVTPDALRAKGLASRRVFRHVVKNAAPQIFTVLGLQFGFQLGGSVLVEAVFSWPGTGYLLNLAIFQRDIPVLQGVILVLATFFVLLNLAVDLLQTLVDPRIARH